jgi:hypothetical protein
LSGAVTVTDPLCSAAPGSLAQFHGGPIVDVPHAPSAVWCRWRTHYRWSRCLNGIAGLRDPIVVERRALVRPPFNTTAFVQQRSLVAASHHRIRGLCSRTPSGTPPARPSCRARAVPDRLQSAISLIRGAPGFPALERIPVAPAVIVVLPGVRRSPRSATTGLAVSLRVDSGSIQMPPARRAWHFDQARASRGER